MDVVDQRSAAELPAAVEQGGDPGPFVHVRIVTADDPLLVLEAVLGAAGAASDYGGFGGLCRRFGGWFGGLFGG